MLKLVVETTF